MLHHIIFQEIYHHPDGGMIRKKKMDKIQTLGGNIDQIREDLGIPIGMNGMKN